MALIRGTQGKIYYAAHTVLKMNNWTINPVAGVDDVTDFGSRFTERAYTGVVDATGSLSGHYELWDTSTGGGETIPSPVVEILRSMMTTAVALAKGQARFVESSKSMFFGNILFTDAGKNQPAQGNQTVTLNWASDGRLRWSSDSST